MKINEIKADQHIKIGKTSITVKEDGKTAGLIRSIDTWNSLPMNKQSDYFHLLKRAGVWGYKDYIHNVVIDGKDVYLFINRKTIEFYERYKDAIPEEAEKVSAEMTAIMQGCAKEGIAVLIRYFD